MDYLDWIDFYCLWFWAITLSMLKNKSGLTSNPIGTVHRKLTRWSRSPDQPISRQQQTKRNEDSLGIKMEEYFMDNIRLSGCFRVNKGRDHGITSGKKWGKVVGQYNDGIGSHLSLHNLTVSPLPIYHWHANWIVFCATIILCHE